MQDVVVMDRGMNSDSTLIDQASIKLANRKVILDLMRRERLLTKQEISEKTGISFPTVSSSINHLMNQRLVEEAGTADSTGGRKPKLIKFLPNSRFIFGVTVRLGGIRVIRTNIDMEIVDDMHIPMEREESEDIMKNAIYEGINSIIRRNEISRDSILGAGIVVPGFVNRKLLLLEASSSLGIKNVSFKQLRDKLRLPLFIENEANAAALAEQNLGIAQGMKNLIYISITDSVGSGMIIGGKLYMGAHNRAGQLGHQTVVTGGRPCSCGKKGCWEQYVSEKVLLESFAAAKKVDQTTLNGFFEELSEQEPAAVTVWEDYLNYLIIGLHNIVTMYDPHYIVLGGNIARYPQYLLPPLMKGVFGPSSFYMRNDTYILTSELDKDASVLGAALIPLGNLYD